MKIYRFKDVKIPWRDVPAWMAVAVALSGILLTYWEVKTANEREIIFRVWDAAQALYDSSIDFPANSSEDRVDIEMGLLKAIGAHSGLIADRALFKKSIVVGRAWSVAHLAAKRTTPEEAAEKRNELTSELSEMIDLLAKELGTFNPDWPFNETFSIDDLE